VCTATGDYLPVLGSKVLQESPAWDVHTSLIMHRFATEEHQALWRASWETLAVLFPEDDPIKRVHIPAGDREGRYRLLYTHQCRCELWLAQEVYAGQVPVDQAYTIDFKRVKELKIQFPGAFRLASRSEQSSSTASGAANVSRAPGPNHACNVEKKKLHKGKKAASLAAKAAKDSNPGNK
jgi:hypothetical protein